MSQSNKRSLRERRAPRNFDSDNEEQDPWGYAKPAYSKEIRNPSQQLNYEAKLLTKFLQALNKAFRDHEHALHDRSSNTIREHLSLRERKPKVVEMQIQQQKRAGEGSREGKPDTTKKVKQPFQIKAQVISTDPTSGKKESFLNAYKALNTQSANKILSMELTLKEGSDPARLKLERAQLLSKQLQPNSSTRKLQGKAQKNGDGLNRFFSFNGERSKAIEQLSLALNIPKPSLTEGKIFKRSAYHVAIAYHIYIKKLKQKGGSEVDPTYYARKLREGMKK